MPGAALSRRRLAEFFDLPEPYLAKLLQQLSTGGILRSVPGVNGGYRLARAAETISALDVVQAVQKDSAAFHCAEIRRRGPVGLTDEQCTRPCGIAAVMHRAEQACAVRSPARRSLTWSPPLPPPHSSALRAGSGPRRGHHGSRRSTHPSRPQDAAVTRPISRTVRRPRPPRTVRAADGRSSSCPAALPRATPCPKLADVADARLLRLGRRPAEPGSRRRRTQPSRRDRRCHRPARHRPHHRAGHRNGLATRDPRAGRRPAGARG